MPLLRKGVAAIFGALSLGLLIPTGRALWSWFLTRTTDTYYIDSDYLGQGLFLGIPASVSLLVCLYVLFRRNAHGGWIVIPLVLLLFLAVAIPSTLHSPMAYAHSRVMQRVRVVSIAMTAWGDQHGAFPATEEELQAALKQYARLASVIEESPSLFARKGQRIPYRTVLVPAAKGPHQPTPPGDQPGIVYCAVSSDLRRAWFTATVLDELVGGAIVFMEFEPGLRWLEEKLPEPAPK